MDLTDLSTDQQYLLDICHAVSTGICPDKLSSKAPGNMSHARWLTTANRILRLYIAEKKPCKNLVKLAKYVSLVYAPTWFEIKKTKSCVEGSKLLHNMIKRIHFINKVEKAVIEKSISNNGFFAYHENVVLSMIFDSDEKIRKKAVNILRSIKEPQPNIEPRKFKVPVINFKAKNYYEMINLKKTVITVPPLLSNIKMEDLEDLWKSSRGEILKKIPCHSQAVERCVKLVSEASGVVAQKHRHGVILNKIQSRKHMPVFNTKSDFNIV